MLNKGILLSGKEKLYNVYRGTVSNVSLSYSPQTDIKAGTRVNITVNANSGYQNPSVSVTKNDGTGSVTVSGSGSSRYFTMPKSDVTINASASLIPTYSVSGSASGGGISFSKTSGIRAGETVTVYLSPNSYYTLSSLTSSPSVSFSGSGNTRTFKMPSSNVRVTAKFVANYTHLITLGTRSLNMGQLVEVGFDNFNANFGSISPTTVRGDTIQSLVAYFGKANNSYETHIRTSYSSDNNYPESMKITRTDTNKTITVPQGEGYAAYYHTPASTGLRSNIFNENEVGKTIPIKIQY